MEEGVKQYPSKLLVGCHLLLLGNKWLPSQPALQ
jgi:hypothetical protein